MNNGAESECNTPFLITQKHITKKTADGRYTREDAIKLMLDLQTLEMGKMEQTQGPGRHTPIFRKVTRRFQ